MTEVLVNGTWPLHVLPHREYLWTREPWEPERLTHMHAHLKPGMVLFDIGAEQGDMSALYASWGCQMVLVEPHPQVWPNIRSTFDLNGLEAPLASFPGFAAAEVDEPPVEGWPEQATGVPWPREEFAHLFMPNVPRCTIDRLAEVVTPDAITMDVEGSELWALYGARDTLVEHKPLVWVSVHEEMMRRDYRQDPADLHAFMAELGYTGELLAVDHEAHWFFHP